MVREEKKPACKLEVTKRQREIIQRLLLEYDFDTCEDIWDALKELLNSTIKEMMETEMDNHLGYQKSEHTYSDNYRNGYKKKSVNSSYGSMIIKVPQDRQSTFEPQVVKKRKKDISDIDQKIVSVYAEDMTIRQISDTLKDIYDFKASESFISNVTNKILLQIEESEKRPLDEIYPVIFIDTIHYSVRNNGIIKKFSAYVIFGFDCCGREDVLTIKVGENENAKYWLSILNGLKKRGIKDILIICADELTGICEALKIAFPKTEYRRCIVHKLRNKLKFISDKNRKNFAKDLKKIYNTPAEEKAE